MNKTEIQKLATATAQATVKWLTDKKRRQGFEPLLSESLELSEQSEKKAESAS